jgi:hypothetical protein
MTLWTCARESAVCDAAAAACASCRGVERVIRLLAVAHAGSGTASADPELLFQKARHTRRIHAEAKVARIMTTGQIGAFVIVLAVMGCFLLTQP